MASALSRNTTRLVVLAASLTALAACQQGGGGGGGGAPFMYGGGYQPIPIQPFYHQPYMIPTNGFAQPRGFSCNRVGSTTYCN